MNRRTLILIILSMIILYKTEIHAEDPKEIQFSTFIFDNPKILNADDYNKLNHILKNIEKETTNQIFIAIIHSLNGSKIEDFASELYEYARPGMRVKNNGILIVLSIGEKQVRITTGSGLENVITDLYAKAIIKKYMIPHFKKNDFKSGLHEAIINIKEELYKPDIKEFFSMVWNIKNFEKFLTDYPQSTQKCDALMFLGRFYEDLWNSSLIKFMKEDERKKSIEYYQKYLSECPDGIWKVKVKHELSQVQSKKPDSIRYLPDD